MNKEDIIKDFVGFCHDLKLNINKKENKNKYINAYMQNYVKYNGILNFDKEKKKIENTLKYNTLTIDKYKKEYEESLNILPF